MSRVISDGLRSRVLAASTDGMSARSAAAWPLSGDTPVTHSENLLKLRSCCYIPGSCGRSGLLSVSPQRWLQLRQS
jgi:hypothetical protein